MLYLKNVDSRGAIDICVYTSYKDTFFAELHTATIFKIFVDRYGDDLGDFVFLNAIVFVRTDVRILIDLYGEVFKKSVREYGNSEDLVHYLARDKISCADEPIRSATLKARE